MWVNVFGSLIFVQDTQDLKLGITSWTQNGTGHGLSEHLNLVFGVYLLLVT